MLKYVLNNYEIILKLTIEHIQLVLIALVIACGIGLLLGVVITRIRIIPTVVLNIANVIYTIPSIALFAILIPFVGIGFKPAIIALVGYVQLVIISHVYIGITNIAPGILDAANGTGMTSCQRLFFIELPLAFPIIMGGLRTTAVLMVGIAGIAAYIGAGGLGELIFRGISSVDTNAIGTGSVLLAILAIFIDILLGWLEQKLIPVFLRDANREVKV